MSFLVSTGFNESFDRELRPGRPSRRRMATLQLAATPAPNHLMQPVLSSVILPL